jgi:TonB-dependent starch-binding outer membrane protein SusC
MKENNSFFKRALFLFVAIAMVSMVWAQKKTVNGVVKDTSGEPIIGASVVVAGTTLGTVTDLNGVFHIEVPTTAKNFEVSYVGMEKKVVAITGTEVVITLQDESKGLDELVVVGYGVVKKRDLTGSITSIKSSDIMKTTSSNAMQSMQGKVAGLDIQQSSGQAGSGLSITLRGNRSITASNSPLILVDGIEYGSTLDLNPSDIESMEVLKDASSTAIYGTRGANGVILITTKRGKSGATKVSVNSYLSVNAPTNVPQMMYGDKEVQRLIDKANYVADKASGNWGTSNLTPEEVLTESLEDFTEIGIYNDKSYTDWLDIIMQTGYTKNIEVGVAGGNDKTTFSLSLGGMFEEGLMKNDLQNRYNVKTSVDHKVNKYLKVGSNILFTYKDKDARSSSVYSQAMKMTTITHAYTTDGTLIANPNPRYTAHCNPLLDEVDGAYVNNTLSNRLFGNAYIEITPFKNLIFKSNFGLDKSNSRNGIYADYQSVARYQSPATSYMESTYSMSTGYTWDNTLNYSTNFGGSKHDFNGLLGNSVKHNVYESTSTAGAAGAEHYYSSLFYDLSKITSPTTTTNYIESSMLSYFGRINYKFNEKYLLTATLRSDGSSTLAPGHKWGYFPSAAGAWRMNEESFMKGISWLDNLKLRASWGITGNAAVDAYSTMTTLSTTPVYYYLGGTSISGNLPSSLGNADLKWETTQSKEFAVDFGIFKNRISGTVNYFLRNTYDLLYPRSLPASSVYPNVMSNIGETAGQGIEISLNTLVFDSKNFKWDINWSYSRISDEITSLYEGVTQNITGNTGQIVGQPVYIYYDYKANGCWNVGEYDQYVTDWQERHPDETIGYVSGYGEAGTIKIVDKDDDGNLDNDDKYVYNRSAKHIFGMNNTITYKDFTLSVLAYARFGAYIAYDMYTQLNYESANWGDLDYWTPTNTSAKFPSPGAASSTWSSYGSAAKYVIGDYLKIKDITLNYKLPRNIVKSIGLSSVQVYGSLKNYFTFSNIENYDPERGGSISFPLAKQMVFGLNIEL